MDSEQFKVVADFLRQIAENTKPPNRLRLVLEWAGLIIGLSGLIAVIEKVLEWWR